MFGAGMPPSLAQAIWTLGRRRDPAQRHLVEEVAAPQLALQDRGHAGMQEVLHLALGGDRQAQPEHIGQTGALEVAVTALAMRDGFLPPTINLTDPDPECDLDYIPNVARRAEYRYALSNGFGFGGHNASLVFARWDEHDNRREPEKVQL